VSYLLDTNVCIALINGKSDQVRQHYAQATRRNAELFTSPIVAHELWYGVAKSDRVPQNSNRLATFLGRDVVLLGYTNQDARSWNGRARGLANMTRSSPVRRSPGI
jgi:tRNA(fMet)-specific endonuclease VapC